MDNIKDVVREKYAEAALRVHSGGSSCCGAGPATDGCDPISGNLYEQRQTAELPESAVLASLGCGSGVDVDAIAPQVDGKFMSAFVRAVKPGGKGI
jgi:arsenite methyltransferase